VSVDSGFFPVENMRALEEQKIEAYMRYSNLMRCARGRASPYTVTCDGN